MPFGDGTSPYFSGNPTSGYPLPPESWTRMNYGPVPSGPPDHCPLPKLDGKQLSDKYDNCFQQSSNKYNIDWRILKALAATESGPNFNQLDNGQGYYGVMQIWSRGSDGRNFTTDQLKNNPCLNIDLGAKDLATKLKTTGNAQQAFANYKGFHSFTAMMQSSSGPGIYNKFKSYLSELTGVSV